TLGGPPPLQPQYAPQPMMQQSMMPPTMLPPGMPPPMHYPPMMMPPPPPRGGGFSKAILVTLATTIFGLSLTLNLYLLLMTGLLGKGGMSGLSTSVERDGDAKQQIAVLPVHGLIIGKTYEQFDRWMSVVENDTNVKALVIDVDTPGGEVTASDQIHRRIAGFKQSRRIPVVVSMGGMGTSGGYYVSANADWIVAQPTTLTGNIGVRWDRLSLAKMADKIGVEDNSLHSSGADFKTAGSMWKNETPEETAYLTGLIDEAFRIFKGVVKDGRGERLKQPIDVIANGKVYTATEAHGLGLIDEVDYPDAAIAKAAALAGLTSPRVVRYSRPPGFFESFGAESSITSLNANSTGLKFDRNTLHELAAPRMMYHWTGR
ncbi:MAG TPA: signal peptide peptidase SppA, partial [Tepidisphaeraceae bacterium]|nr:signal peptide peptidase SppA [Tepidisphaeraceae bacterium]